MRIQFIEHDDSMARIVTIDGQRAGTVDFNYTGCAWHTVRNAKREKVGHVKRTLPAEGYAVTVAEMLGAYDRAA